MADGRELDRTHVRATENVRAVEFTAVTHALASDRGPGRHSLRRWQDAPVSTFVLLPGAGGSAWYWSRVVPLLADAGHEAIAVDLPGDDESDFPGWPAIPTRVPAGAQDRFFPVEFQRALARDRLGVDADVLPGGHLIGLAQPVMVANYLLQR